MIKKLFTVFFSSCFLWSNAQTWKNLTENPKASFLDSAIVDSNNSYAVGWKGAVFKSTNGGNTWTELQSGTTEHLTSNCVVGSVVYATAPQEAKILSSSDEQIFTSFFFDSYNGNQVHFYNNLVGFVASGQKGKLAKTSNGGDSWQIIETNYQNSIKKVFFVSATNEFAIAHKINNNVPKLYLIKN